MRGHTKRFYVAAGILVTVSLAAGCDFYPPPSQDAPYYYLAGARIDGKVRRCWPEGHAYTEGVLKADAELGQQLNPLREFVALDAFWAKDDPRWREAESVAEHVTKLTEQVEVAAETRQKALDALAGAMRQLPADLALTTPEAQEASEDRVWRALAVDGEDLREHISRLEELAAAKLRLCKRVQECAEHFSSDAVGLRFADETCQRDVDTLYKELQQRLCDRRDAFLAFAEHRLEEIGDALKPIDKRKQRDEYQYLIDHCIYLRNKLGEMLKAFDKLIEASKKELQAHTDSEAELSAQKVEFLRKHIDRLNAERAELQTRIGPILERAKATSAQQSESSP